jgi:hypothetical protein
VKHYRFKAITTVLGGSRINTVIGLGYNAGYFCLSLLDAGMAERATVYDVYPKASAAGRAMARRMDLSHRIEFVDRALDLDFVRTLPKVDMIICLNLLHHAGIKFDKAAVGRDGWESSAAAWLSEMQRKCELAIVGIGFEETKQRNWDAPHPDRPARFAQCMERAGWSLLYDANVRDIEKLGVERAKGRYTKGGALHTPLPKKQNSIIGALTRLSRAVHIQSLPSAISNKRQKYHLYIFEAEKVTWPHLVILAGLSGSGKSTFVDQLRARELPEEINARLPAGIGDWPMKGSSMRPVVPRVAPGIILHYDMNGRGIAAGRDFCDDPTLSCVTPANAVTVVNLRPPPDLLINQLVAREGGGRTKEEVLEETFTWRLLQSSYVEHFLRRWKPWIARKRRQVCRRKIDLYEQDGWLDELYERWQAYLRSLVAKGTTVEQIFLEPDPSTQVGNAYSWRIASKLDKAAQSQVRSGPRAPHVR